MVTRRRFLTWCGSAAVFSGTFPPNIGAQTSPVMPVVPGPEVDEFKAAQQQLLLRYGVPARSRYVKVESLGLTAHVLEAGAGSPVLLLHGGIATAAHFAPLMGQLQRRFHLFSVDRTGCGLTDKIDFRGVELREHAVAFIGDVMDSLQLKRAALIANSMGGLWALLFALARPERVTQLVLFGEPAASGPTDTQLPSQPPPDSLENIRAIYRLRVANGDRLPIELLREGLASVRLPGVSLALSTLVAQVSSKGRVSTYLLRPELKTLEPPTLFGWGDKDIYGPPIRGQEMAALAPRARCEVLPDAGHWAWMDQPELCARLSMQFLANAG